MRDAVIVSAARTPIGRAYKGAFNNMLGPTLGSYAAAAAVERSGVDGAEVDDVIWGSALQQGSQALNIGRLVALRSGLPVTVPGMSIDRQCASGLMSIATAAKQIVIDRMDVVLAGGQEAISTVQTAEFRMEADMDLVAKHPMIHLPMLQTAEVVAQRYDIGREAQDEYALQSQRRTAEAQQQGRFDDEIVSVTTMKKAFDKETGETREQEVTIDRDEGNRPETTLEALSALPPVNEGGSVTAGNASQQNDAAAGCLVVAEDKVEELGLEPILWFHSWSAAGCDPSRMGIGPVPAVERLFARNGLGWDDIGLIELNEAFAPQALAVLKGWGFAADDSRRELVNVNGSGISLGHPIGATGIRILADMAHEMQRREVRYGLETMCIGGGQGMAAVFERAA